MSGRPQTRRYPARRLAAGPTVCPACRARFDEEFSRCPACGFTGADTVAIFGSAAPPLTPVLDAVGWWGEAALARIAEARRRFRKSVPQIDIRVCVVRLEPHHSPAVFGFWLFNASPLVDGETEAQRAWTVLLVIDAASGRAAVVPGYGAEPWLADDKWQLCLDSMRRSWSAGDTAGAVVAFHRESCRALEAALRALPSKLRGKEAE